jgi:hypothetical protein
MGMVWTGILEVKMFLLLLCPRVVQHVPPTY